MEISVFGLGYVGCVTMGCLAELGHSIVGVDVKQNKVDLINQGKATVVEEGIEAIIAEQRENGRVRATADALEAVRESEVSLICVGTPSTAEGHLDLGSIHRVAEQIGQALRQKTAFHTVAIRSTVPPGTNEKLSRTIGRESGRRSEDAFAVISNPEFLREGTGVEDFYHPPMVLLGGKSERGLECMREVYGGIDAPVHITQVGIAEILKFLNNSFHALKVAFANEVGRICRDLDIDPHAAMQIFCSDTTLNISPAYLRPGFAFGGSCLPKDLKALCTLARDNGVAVPVINAVSESNEEQKRLALRIIESTEARRIGFLGFSFKPGTDDLRNSPAVELAEWLLERGYELRIYDDSVVYSNLTGRNRDYIKETLPHLEQLLVPSVEEAILEAQVVVVAKADRRFARIADTTAGIPVIDLVGIVDRDSPGEVIGLA